VTAFAHVLRASSAPDLRGIDLDRQFRFRKNFLRHGKVHPTGFARAPRALFFRLLQRRRVEALFQARSAGINEERLHRA